MAHTIREKNKLLARVKRIRGQVEAIERALGEEAECERIMHMIAGIRGGVAGLTAAWARTSRRHCFGCNHKGARRFALSAEVDQIRRPVTHNDRSAAGAFVREAEGPEANMGRRTVLHARHKALPFNNIFPVLRSNRA
jgi:DNA-binding FrmR family transcriptional regulator